MTIPTTPTSTAEALRILDDLEAEDRARYVPQHKPHHPEPPALTRAVRAGMSHVVTIHANWMTSR